MKGGLRAPFSILVRRNPLKRQFGFGDLHFVTFSCFRRRPQLAKATDRDCFVEVLDEIRRRHGFRVVGYVVMPEHVHLLASEPIRLDLSKALQVVKQKVARRLLPKCAERGEEFWQRRFYDFNVWSEKKIREKLNYMHANPVTRKLVAHPKDWPWSSWGYYAGTNIGKISIDGAWEKGL